MAFPLILKVLETTMNLEFSWSHFLCSCVWTCACTQMHVDLCMCAAVCAAIQLCSCVWTGACCFFLLTPPLTFLFKLVKIGPSLGGNLFKTWYFTLITVEYELNCVNSENEHVTHKGDVEKLFKLILNWILSEKFKSPHY